MKRKPTNKRLTANRRNAPIVTRNERSFQRVTCNLGESRRERLHGREYIVAPATLIVGDSVLNGSQGPLLYRSEEVAKDPWAWNGVPLVAWHPTKEQDGEVVNVSARDPEVLNEWGLGFLFNANADEGDLTGEAWFDVTNVKAVDLKLAKMGVEPILPKLKTSEQIELSTGLFTENVPAPKDSVTANGDPYDAEATNFRPDHVAILPDEVGACSNEDGCGVNATPTRNIKMCWGKPCDGEVSSSPDEGGGGGGVAKPAKVKPVSPKVHGDMKAYGWDTSDGSTYTHKDMPGHEIKVGHEAAGGGRTRAVAEHKTPDGKSMKFQGADLIGYHVMKESQRATKSSQLANRQSLEKLMKTKIANRKSAVKFLTSNCDCWKPKKAQAALNAMTDDQVVELANNSRIVLVVNAAGKARVPVTNDEAGAWKQLTKRQQQTARTASVVYSINADGEEGGTPGVDIAGLAEFLGIAVDPASDPVGFVNELKGKLDEISGKLGIGTPPPAEEAPEEEPMTMAEADPEEDMEANADTPDEPQPQTHGRGGRGKVKVTDLPVAIQNRLKLLEKLERDQKRQIINRLLVNVAQAKRQRVGEKLYRLSLNELEDRLELMPQQATANRQDQASGINWALAGGGAGITDNDRREPDSTEDEDVLAMTMPVWNSRDKRVEKLGQAV